MSEIPEDIMKMADSIYSGDAYTEGDSTPMMIARGMMAERQRCLDHCDYVHKNIRCGKTERRRFDIFDLNHIFKGAVKCVRERIAGDWEKNWKPDPDADKAQGEN